MTQEKQPAAPEAREIDDATLDRVVGGAIGATRPTDGIIIDGTDAAIKPATTNSLGGEDWGRK